MFRITMLPANEGDAIWVEYGTRPTRHVLIDCGRKTAYRAVTKRLDASPRLKFELFVLTHVDADHISGAVPLLRDRRFDKNRVGDVWFNGWRHLHGKHKDFQGPGLLGALQGEFFGAMLRDKEFAWNEAFDGGPAMVKARGKLPEIKLAGGMKLTLLGPTKDKLEGMQKKWREGLPDDLKPGDFVAALDQLENKDRRHLPDLLSGPAPSGPIHVESLARKSFKKDRSKPNGSSISFLAEYKNRAVLFAGDAHAPQLVTSIKRLLRQRRQKTLAIDALKMSHHGSKKNNSTELFDLLDCPCYLVSTNGKQHDHPDREALARVLNLYESGVELYFNFKTKQTRPWAALREKYGFETFYGSRGELALDLL